MSDDGIYVDGLKVATMGGWILTPEREAEIAAYRRVKVARAELRARQFLTHLFVTIEENAIDLEDKQEEQERVWAHVTERLSEALLGKALDGL